MVAVRPFTPFVFSEELFCDIEPEDSPKLVKFINNKIFVLTNLGKLICHQNRQITNINVPGKGQKIYFNILIWRGNTNDALKRYKK